MCLSVSVMVYVYVLSWCDIRCLRYYIIILLYIIIIYILLYIYYYILSYIILFQSSILLLLLSSSSSSPLILPIFILYLSVLTYTYLYSSILSLPIHPPLIHSILVGTYIRLFILFQYSLQQSPNI
jgi:hypothetical protein